MQNSLAKEWYIVSYITFETIKETSISSFRNSRSISEIVPHRSRVFKTQVLSKKNFTYSGVFKPYSDILMPYSGVFMQKNFCKYKFMESYSGVFKPYSDVLCPYSGVFIQFMEIESLRLDFQLDFFPH